MDVQTLRLLSRTNNTVQADFSTIFHGAAAMYNSSLIAFLHHLLAFTLVAAVSVQVALFKPPLTVSQARRIQRTDMIYGLSAVLLIVVGLLRVFMFEKGSDYYFSNAYFHGKLTLFVIVALLSIYPTVLFASWKKWTRQGMAPEVSDTQVRRVRMLLMFQLTGIVGILFCATFMADGWGYLK
jgi:putative membrane protein